ncbi:hypothetical protein SAMN06298224_0814 [Fibrobacter sp. UWB16]|uniref:hypothetical protein n=1 Tax=Fibrobacter sp. UWB16 TaxID=1945874 RepID=UPI000BD4EB3F|nr:hypothetical protein [Fibrobacter sp. UWB16]SOD12685.1 hypothetical protein SAMN06298224_0814 [Fibrobacter sp. UWB16]
MTATYVKLQDAHASETGAIGTWQMIGYIAPGSKQGGSSESYSTSVFDYTNAFTGTGTSGTTMVGSMAANQEGWRATAKTALNDCTIQSYWKIVMNQAGNGASVSYTASITDNGNSTSNANCKTLTANFENIGHD